MKRTGSGFTIVELLVVIVVIAILAAITIVSYNGIAERARNTELLGKVDAYTKAFQLYKAQNSTYPAVDVAESGTANIACLGDTSSFPADTTYQNGSCLTMYNNLKASPSLASQLKTVVSNLPNAALPSVSSSDNSISIRGVLYSTGTDRLTASIQYFIKGDRDCARGTKLYNLSTWPGITVCTVTLS